MVIQLVICGIRQNMEFGFPVVVELARTLVREAHGKNLYDAEIAALQSAWESIEYQEIVEDTYKFTKKYQDLYRFPEKDKKLKTIITSSSKIIRLFANKYNLENLTRNNFRRRIQELVDKNIIDISPYLTKDLSIQTLDESDDVVASFDEESDPNIIDRDAEISEIESILNDNSILILYGSQGIGKTTLVTRLYAKEKENIRLFYTDLSYIKDFRQWAYNIISQAKYSDKTNDDNLSSRLYEVFEEIESLVVLDSIFNLDNEISAFLESFIFNSRSKTKFILISSKKINPKISNSYLGYFHLKGLESSRDVSQFFKSLGLKSPEFWGQMNTFYEGNFREIEYAARFIRDLFAGDVGAYWNSNSRVMSPDAKSNFKSVKFSQLDYKIFAMFADEEDSVISANLIRALRQDSRTSETFARINYLGDLGYLIQAKEGKTNRIRYSISPLLKCYLIQEEKLES